MGREPQDLVCFSAQIQKVQTLVDGGIRLTLDLPETAVLEAARLMEYRRLHVAGDFTFEPRKPDVVGQGKWDAKRS